MRNKPLLWQIFPSFLILIICALVLVTWYFSTAQRSFFYQQTASNLENKAYLVERQIRGRVDTDHAPELETLCQQLGPAADIRITIISSDGTVLGDSEEDPIHMDNHANRPEISTALKGKVGQTTRFSRTLLQDMVYIAVPVIGDKGVTGVVRTSQGVAELDNVLVSIRRRVVQGGVLVAILAAVISLWISRHVSRPVETMKAGAEQFAQGNFSKRLKVKGSAEIRQLADTMNLMAQQLDERIQTVMKQRNEQEAVLSSMMEGVLAVDTSERILRCNQAAAALLGISASQAIGKTVQEVVRKADLLRFVANALSSTVPVEGDIVFRQGEERYLQAHGTRLLDGQGQQIGALIVLNDVTRLRRLETVRRDFVANVSHELKTPITAIKGFVETLLDGAMHHPEDAERFLRIIIKQSERLNAIIDDLLDLSRIEQDEDRRQIQLTQGSVEEIIRSVVQACSIAANNKDIALEIDCQQGLLGNINAPLLEQAITNLVDNAIKYSSAASRVHIRAAKADNAIEIRVQDWGPGISKEHLPRLFERFYRVDKARSRQQGGTGLGLAITKHIIQAHHGQIQVESEVGNGSTFIIQLPQA